MSQDAAELASRVTIHRDEFGVPHVFGEDEQAALFGQGYAQAEDNLPGIMRVYRAARGRSAEAWGPEHLGRDRLVRQFRVHQTAKRLWPGLDEELRGLLDAFARGVGFYLDTHADEREDWMLPPTPIDPVAFARLFSVEWIVRREGGPEVRPTSASNQFAIAAQRSASGHTLVSMDPHLPWSGPFLWWEGHLRGGSIHAYGAALYGLPGIVMGHNGRIAWCMTANSPDLLDKYELRLEERGGRLGYRYDGSWRPVQREQHQIPVWRDGRICSEEFVVERAHLGPIVRDGDRALAVWTAMDDHPGPLAADLGLARAGSVAEAKRLLAGQDFEQWNIVIGDREGHIFYVWNARAPQRPDGYDWSGVVPGDRSATQWGPWVPFDDLPQAEDPASGFLQNCNNAPWFVTAGLDMSEGDFPDWLVRGGQTDRGERALELLSSQEKISFERLQEIATDVHVTAARDAIPRLAAAYERGRDAHDPEGELEPAVRLLREWDLQATVESKATALFVAWQTCCTVLARQDPGRPEADQALLGLRLARDLLIDALGRIDPPWGDVHRIERGGRSLPAPGHGTLRAALGRLDGRRLVCAGGSSFTMVVELSDPPRAVSILPYGQSQRPDSPHFADQMPLHAQRRFKPAWWTEADVKAHARRIYHPGDPSLQS